jgi:hypothetical protein
MPRFGPAGRASNPKARPPRSPTVRHMHYWVSRARSGWPDGAAALQRDRAPIKGGRCNVADEACTLSVMAAVTDVGFLASTLPHISRFFGDYPFRDRVIFVDTQPPAQTFKERPGIGTVPELLSLCGDAVESGHFDRIEPINYEPATVKNIYRKHFGRTIGYLRDFRGSSLYGYIYGIEHCQTDLVFHMDSDMLGYSGRDPSWLEKAISIYRSYPELLVLSPRSGPPRRDGTLLQEVLYQHDARGFYAFSVFTTRKFLISQNRLAQLLPMKPLTVSLKRYYYSLIRERSPYWGWETMVSALLERHGMIRADLDWPEPWTLHTPDHGRRFQELLPSIVDAIEQGCFPESQAGDYDLDLCAWDTFLAT